MEKIKIELLNGGVAPQPSKEEPCFELVLPSNVNVGRGKHEISLGFSITLPKNKVALLMPRNDVAQKGILGYLNWGEEGPFNVRVVNDVVDEDRFNFINSKKEQFYIMDFNIRSVGSMKVYNVNYQEKVAEPTRIATCEVENSIVTCVETGEVKLQLNNRGENPVFIERGMCIARMLIIDAPEVELEIVEEAKAREADTTSVESQP